MIWDILGIKPTKDIKEIKKAYVKLAKEFNPEEHPEEFREIYDAYKSACRYAKTQICYDTSEISTDTKVLQGHQSDMYSFDFSSVNDTEVVTEKISYTEL